VAASGNRFALEYIDLKAQTGTSTCVAVSFECVAASHIAQKMAPVPERYLLPAQPFTSMLPYVADGQRTTERAVGGFRITSTGVRNLDEDFEDE